MSEERHAQREVIADVDSAPALLLCSSRTGVSPHSVSCRAAPWVRFVSFSVLLLRRPPPSLCFAACLPRLGRATGPATACTLQPPHSTLQPVAKQLAAPPPGLACVGYNFKIEQDDDPAAYAVIRGGGWKFSEYSEAALYKRPEKPLEIFEFQGCPFCKKVRGGLREGAPAARGTHTFGAFPLGRRCGRSSTTTTSTPCTTRARGCAEKSPLPQPLAALPPFRDRGGDGVTRPLGRAAGRPDVAADGHRGGRQEAVPVHAGP